jgi:hypothetical protein
MPLEDDEAEDEPEDAHDEPAEEERPAVHPHQVDRADVGHPEAGLAAPACGAVAGRRRAPASARGARSGAITASTSASRPERHQWATERRSDEQSVALI